MQMGARARVKRHRTQIAAGLAIQQRQRLRLGKPKVVRAVVEDIDLVRLGADHGTK